MKFKILSILLFCFILISSQVLADPGIASMTFLKVGNSARAIGMGNASCAIDDGGSSTLYFNPASAAYVENVDVSFTYTDWFMDTNFDFFNAVKKMGKFSYGVSLTYLNGGEFDRREEDRPSEEPDGTFSAHSMALGMSVSRHLNDDVAVGFTGKFLFEKIEVEDATGFATDFGFIYRPGMKKLTLGLSVSNFGQKVKFVEEKFGLPTIIRTGFTYQMTPALLLAAEINKASDSELRVQAGLDLNLRDLVFLRSGYKLNYDNENYSIGAGIKYKSYSVDYAFLPFSNELDNTHYFTLRLKMN